MDAIFEPEISADEIVIGRVTVFRILESDGGIRDYVRTDGGSDNERLDVSSAVGMLAIASHALLCCEGAEPEEDQT